MMAEPCERVLFGFSSCNFLICVSPPRELGSASFQAWREEVSCPQLRQFSEGLDWCRSPLENCAAASAAAFLVTRWPRKVPFYALVSEPVDTEAPGCRRDLGGPLPYKYSLLLALAHPTVYMVTQQRDWLPFLRDSHPCHSAGKKGGWDGRKGLFFFGVPPAAEPCFRTQQEACHLELCNTLQVTLPPYLHFLFAKRGTLTRWSLKPISSLNILFFKHFMGWKRINIPS